MRGYVFYPQGRFDDENCVFDACSFDSDSIDIFEEQVLSSDETKVGEAREVIVSLPMGVFDYHLTPFDFSIFEFGSLEITDRKVYARDGLGFNPPWGQERPSGVGWEKTRPDGSLWAKKEASDVDWGKSRPNSSSWTKKRPSGIDWERRNSDA